jgi:uncharacterized tellurite resistance protein B-like protein
VKSTEVERALAERDALLGILIGAIHADGKVVRAEVREAELQARGAPTLGLRGAEVSARLNEVKAALAAKGEPAFLDACVAALSLELRVHAFRAAAEIVAADDEVLPSEERYLARLAAALDTPR